MGASAGCQRPPRPYRMRVPGGEAGGGGTTLVCRSGGGGCGRAHARKRPGRALLRPLGGLTPRSSQSPPKRVAKRRTGSSGMAPRWRRKQSGIIFSMQRTRLGSQGGAVGSWPWGVRAGGALYRRAFETLSTHAASRTLPQGALGRYECFIDTIRREGVGKGGGGRGEARLTVVEDRV